LENAQKVFCTISPFCFSRTKRELINVYEYTSRYMIICIRKFPESTANNYRETFGISEYFFRKLLSIEKVLEDLEKSRKKNW